MLTGSGGRAPGGPTELTAPANLTESTELMPLDRPSAWRGAVEWTTTANGSWQPWRIPPTELRGTLSSALTERSMIGNGVRFCVTTDATSLELDIVGDHERDGVLDVLWDGALIAREPVTSQPRIIKVELASGPDAKTLEVWLPHAARVAIGPVRLFGASAIEPGPRPERRWCAYGSSITQCNTADGPTRTWPAALARALDLDLTALGMAGQCHLDQAVARTIGALDLDLVSLCLGINAYNASTFNERSLPSAVTGFIRTIRDRHPRAPILVCTPIASPDREQLVNDAGLTLARTRELVAQSVEVLKDLGDRQLHLINGLDILPATDHHLLGDGLHPTDAGYQAIAERLAPHFAAVLPAG